MRTTRAVVTIRENKDISCTRKTWFNPGALVLEVEFLISRCSAVIGLWVAPAVQEITTMMIVSAVVACCFLSRGAMIDDPDFVEVMGAHEHLVEFRVVVHGVHMDPVADEVFAEVDVNEFRMVGDSPIIIFACIEVLDEMVPDVPFPDDVPTGRSGLVHLDEEIREEIIAKGVRVTSLLDSGCS